jgi:hypothetical protein
MRRVVAATEKNSNSSTRHREAEEDALYSSVVSSLCSYFTFLIFFLFQGLQGVYPYSSVVIPSL